MQQIFGFDTEEIVKVSAKTGTGVSELLTTIINKIPYPTTQTHNTPVPWYLILITTHLGVVAWIHLIDGEIKTGDKLILMGTKTWTKVIEIEFCSRA